MKRALVIAAIVVPWIVILACAGFAFIYSPFFP